MAQREPVVPQAENGHGPAREQRAELRRLLGEFEDRAEPMTSVERERLIRAVWDAFADVPTSSFEFIRRKHREIDEEERRLGGEPSSS
ncbi:MAG TPA: hypothetical protein VH482_01760 [Thermomicrobiales bacterium]|jgi:hypothetical protein